MRGGPAPWQIAQVMIYLEANLGVFHPDRRSGPTGENQFLALLPRIQREPCEIAACLLNAQASRACEAATMSTQRVSMGDSAGAPLNRWWTVVAGALGCCVGAGIAVIYAFPIFAVGVDAEFGWNAVSISLA